MELNLANNNAIVTGNTEGIGQAISRLLRQEDVNVPEISRATGYDLMNEEGRTKLISDFPDPDFVIHNLGGIGSDKSKWELAMDKNYKAMVKLTEAYLYGTKIPKRFIVISSIFGKEKGHNPGFTAAKAAQIAYIKSLAGTYKGTTFNVICPGHIDVGKKFLDKPKIIGQPEDVANLVAFLCSNKAKHINGACITVDGGESHSF